MSECGDCVKCCEPFEVKEIKKPGGEMCSKCTGTGCGIYDSRPAACRAYLCLFITDNMPPEMRPDRSGVIIDFNNKKGRIEALMVSHFVDELAVKRQIRKTEMKYKEKVFGVNALPKKVSA